MNEKKEPDEIVRPELVNTVAASLVENVPDGWSKLVLTLEYYSVGMSQLALVVVGADGTERCDMACPDEADEAFEMIHDEQMRAGVQPFTRGAVTILAGIEGSPTVFTLDLDYREPRYEP